MVRLSFWASRSSSTEMPLASAPATAKASISPDATTGGSDSRCQASNSTKAATPNRRNALVTAARISSRR